MNELKIKYNGPFEEMKIRMSVYRDNSITLLFVILSIIASYMLGYILTSLFFDWINLDFQDVIFFEYFVIVLISPFLLYVFIYRLDEVNNLKLNKFKTYLDGTNFIVNPYIQTKIDNIKEIKISEDDILIQSNTEIKIPLKANKYYTKSELSEIINIVKDMTMSNN